MLLANINQSMVMINAYLLDFGKMLACTPSQAGWHCIPSLVPTLQLLFLWLCYFSVWVSWFIYYRREFGPTREWRILANSFYVFCAYVVISVVGLGAADAAQGHCKHWIVALARFFGIFSTGIGIIEWTPQIMTTWRLQGPGSLSLWMLGLQCPGSMIIFIYFTFILHEDITTTIGYFFSSIQQVIILGICAYYGIFARKRNYTALQEKD
eukprot:gnl/Ergobibamus_cyprinoides/358.p1 GENE.gnl/Ergobibamus_cyprinoides/358~~gnl/Ergobibamus_cyprinoides/358.p1  ORF type:complete len:210 (+),score=64.87 gnl/Ergobibamus_cyprinoides/358:212-841(+)